ELFNGCHQEISKIVDSVKRSPIVGNSEFFMYVTANEIPAETHYNAGVLFSCVSHMVEGQINSTICEISDATLGDCSIELTNTVLPIRCTYLSIVKIAPYDERRTTDGRALWQPCGPFGGFRIV